MSQLLDSESVSSKSRQKRHLSDDEYPFSIAGALMIREKLKPIFLRRMDGGIDGIQRPRKIHNVYLNEMSPAPEDNYRTFVDFDSDKGSKPNFIPIAAKAQQIRNMS